MDIKLLTFGRFCIPLAMKVTAILVLTITLCVLISATHGSPSTSGRRSGRASSSRPVDQDRRAPDPEFQYLTDFPNVVVDTKYLHVHANVNPRWPEQDFPRVFEFTFPPTERLNYGRDKPSLTFMFDEVTQYGTRSRQMVFALEAYDEEGRLMENAQQRLRGIRVSCPLSQPFANTIYSQLLVLTCCRRSLTFPTASRCMSVYRSQRV